MKKILIVIQNMQMNGANKSLINLLNVIDKEKYGIDVLAFSHEGLLNGCFPQGVCLLAEDQYLAYFEQSSSAIFKSANIVGKAIRFCSGIEKRVTKTAIDPKTKFVLWKFASKLETEYDAAIAWNEGACHRFLVERVQAKIKIGWSHIDDEAWPYHYANQKKIFTQLDYICTVSQRCKNVLLKRYSIDETRVVVIHNVMPIQVMELASKEQDYTFNPMEINILTIARNELLKNISAAYSAAKVLSKKGFKIHWWVLGSGFSEDQYSSKRDYVSFLRPMKNPYPLLRNCDIYVQPSSLGEAWGMGVNEAKIFGKVVVVSNIEVFKEQVIDQETGLIFDGSVEDLVSKIVLLINNPDLKQKIENNVVNGDWSNIADVDKLYEIL